MPFLKDFIINHNTKIKLWKLNLGELDYFELDEYDSNLIKAKKNEHIQRAFSSLRLIVLIGWSIYPIGYIFGLKEVLLKKWSIF